MKTIKNILLVLLSITLFACGGSDDSKNDTSITEQSSFAMIVVTNTEDNSGFLIPFNGLPKGEIDLTQNIEKGIQLASARNAGVGFDGAVYHTSNTFGTAGVAKFIINSSGNFVADGFIPTGTTTYGGGTTFGFATSDKGYYTNHEGSQTAIQIFNPKSMVRTGQIELKTAIDAIIKKMDASASSKIETTSIGGFMVERDGKFFTEIYLTDKEGFEVADKTFIAVIDVASDSLDKVIEWNDHMKIGYFSYKNVNYVNIDEKGDLYLATFIGNFNDTEGPNFRAIRIKKGTTDIDTTWDLNGNRGDFAGGENFALGGGVKNGKMYVKMMKNTIDISWEGLREKQYYAYEIDIETKDAKRIEDIPVGYWRSVHGPAFYGGKPYFIVENEDLNNPNDPNKGKAYYYSYDPSTNTSKLEITVVGGQPQQILEF